MKDQSLFQKLSEKHKETYGNEIEAKVIGRDEPNEAQIITVAIKTEIGTIVNSASSENEAKEKSAKYLLSVWDEELY